MYGTIHGSHVTSNLDHVRKMTSGAQEGSLMTFWSHWRYPKYSILWCFYVSYAWMHWIDHIGHVWNNTWL